MWRIVGLQHAEVNSWSWLREGSLGFRGGQMPLFQERASSRTHSSSWHCGCHIHVSSPRSEENLSCLSWHSLCPSRPARTDCITSILAWDMGRGKSLSQQLLLHVPVWVQFLQLKKGSEAESSGPSANSQSTTLFWKRRQHSFFLKPFSFTK